MERKSLLPLVSQVMGIANKTREAIKGTKGHTAFFEEGALKRAAIISGNNINNSGVEIEESER